MSLRLPQPIPVAALRAKLDRLVAGEAGRIERLKGLVPSGEGWLRFDISGGRAQIMIHAPREDEEPRVMIIGSGLDRAKLTEMFQSGGAPVARLVANA